MSIIQLGQTAQKEADERPSCLLAFSQVCSVTSCSATLEPADSVCAVQQQQQLSKHHSHFYWCCLHVRKRALQEQPGEFNPLWWDCLTHDIPLCLRHCKFLATSLHVVVPETCRHEGFISINIKLCRDHWVFPQIRMKETVCVLKCFEGCKWTLVVPPHILWWRLLITIQLVYVSIAYLTDCQVAKLLKEKQILSDVKLGLLYAMQF